MDQNFVAAFNHTMLYEVGAFWNPTDPDVIDGNISTREQRKKVGYVNIPADRGGETKYGIAKNANPDVDITNLNLDETMSIYQDSYWQRGSCDQLSYPLSLMHFDACVNHGIRRANKFLQRALGVTEDGQVGPQTLQAVNSSDQQQLIQQLSQIRTDFYNAIVNRDPSQQIFLAGWLRRVNEVTAFTLAALE